MPELATSHLNLDRPLVLKPVDQRHRVGKRRDIAPYLDHPVEPPRKPTFAGFDPEENLDW